MVNYFFIGINSIILLLYGLLSGDGGITVSGKFPASMIVNEEVIVEITVNKGAMTGFAKLQLDLPEGFKVGELENKGANYTYNKGIVKWIWSSLPNENEITVKITLTATEAALGNKTIGAKYSYVENNVKQLVEMAPVEIKILNEGETAIVPDTTGNAFKMQTPAIVNDSSTKLSETLQATSHAEPIGNIEIVPSYSITNQKETHVQINIKKGITSGFARYSDDMPEGFTAKAIKTDGSSFSIADKKLKFVWVNVPEKEELMISYQIIRLTSKEPILLNGEYSYLEHNQSKKSKAAAQSIPYDDSQLAQSPLTETVTENRIEKTETVVIPEEVKKEEPAKTEEQITLKTQASSLETTVEKQNTSTKFCVQIGAFTNNKVSAVKLKNKFKIKETIRSEMQEGYSKFIIGAHNEYKNARDHRNVMVDKNGVKSAFVVAYNNAKRITVQEALMISNQKWFK